MTNINCTENCIYQVEGKCTLNHIGPSNSINNPTNCAYFLEKKKTTTNQGQNLTHLIYDPDQKI
ncbi:hypothetical protein SAMN02746089_01387 [Caldanaerobius fijiensis DSM 17918]|uniref:Hydroxymyristoyl-ACP dehydratase n=1 Tax=Caldanaerobius fijiensis DSM 17918 TaxID=1121256 RepID=A0A1M4ZBL4_9THEO|nr:hypothetical protein [Caldanaerobius fijiensis]SHF15430.1 hypothetical protein SAMN02746089_01387 [Caldanaerobius fijiensis DSM 17918]